MRLTRVMTASFQYLFVAFRSAKVAPAFAERKATLKTHSFRGAKGNIESGAFAE